MRIFKDVEQGSEEWLQLRLGKITGTRMKCILMKKEDPVLIYEIISELLNPVVEDTYQSAEMQRGNDLEPYARQAYEEHTGLKVDKIGFVLHDKYDYCGYSPDGLIKVNKVYKKAVEIKCPSTKTHAKYIIEGGVPKEYEGQILSAFFNCDTIDSLDFMSFDDRCIQKPLHIVNVYREQYEALLKEAEEKVPALWKKVQDNYMKIVF